ncbi:L,D-transpeptidase family protein [Azospirillum sp. A39]|uniref:L,D-transpeptidase family protein n=1 Tax=Azospirillum sp. A39 TaxID=3462279 RepID=UPI0040456858
MTRFASLLFALLLYPTGAGALAPAEPVGPGGGSAAAVREDAVTGLDTAIAVRLIDDSRIVAGRAVDLATVRRFYAQRGFTPLWIDAAGAPTPAAARVLAVLEAAAAEGLDPEDYHAAAIAERLRPPGPAARLDLELLLSDAVMRYGAHVHAGRVTPKAVAEDLAVTPPAVDRFAVAEAAAADGDAALAALAPVRPDYGALKEALRRYRALAAAGGWKPVPAPRVAKLEVGMRDPAVKALRRRLAVTGDLVEKGREAAGKAKDSDLYDTALKAAVGRFQARHGLFVDGVVGAATLTALNVPVDERIGQIVANLERLRWLPAPGGDRYVVVNVPDFTLKAVENGQTALDMRVIVGTKVRRTPVLTSTITSVVLNPTWTVPVRLAREDYLPKLLRDPGYLASHGFTVFSSWAADATPLDSRRIDWKAVGRRIGGMRLRQDPGPNNALGQVKFNIPNGFDVYLHDTPSREKFDRSVRTFSSGCVRVGDPMALAAFVMAGMDDWPAERRQQVLDKGDTKTVVLKRAVPVHILYQTAWMGQDGVVQFREDIYGRDVELLDAVARRAPQRVALGG